MQDPRVDAGGQAGSTTALSPKYRRISQDDEGLAQSSTASDCPASAASVATQEDDIVLNQPGRARQDSVSSCSSQTAAVDPPNPDSLQQDENTPIQGKQNNPVPQKWARRTVFALGKAWYLELLSSLFAISCLAAIVVLLLVHQDKVAPQRAEIFSINSLISIFSSLYRASLVMPIAEGLGQLKWHWYDQPQKLIDLAVVDEASRGALGSLWLILRQVARRNRMYIASFGALITIGTLAIDPFSQALVEHTVCRLHSDTMVAKTARTNYYTAISEGLVPVSKDPTGSIDKPMEVALYTGLMGSGDMSSLLNVDCESGNCTFRASDDGGAYFSSLAICHSCDDITDNVTNTTSRRENTINRVELSFSLSETLNVSFWKMLSSTSVDYEEAFFAFESLTMRTPSDFKQIDGGDVWEVLEPLAVRCTLNPCIKRYSSEVKAGRYIEIEEANDPPILLRKAEYSPFYGALEIGYGLASDSVLIDGEEKPCEPSSDPEPMFVPVNPLTKEIDQYGDPNGGNQVFYPPECIWAVDKMPREAIHAVLSNLLGDVNHADAKSGLNQVRGPIWLKNLFAAGHSTFQKHDDLAKSLATSITATMRNHPSTDGAYNRGENVTTSSKGTSSIVDTCIRVKWRWMIYLAALMVLQLMFVMMVLVRIRLAVGRHRDAQMDWKCSPLPLLFHGLDEDMQQKHQGVGSAHDMEVVAKGVTVKLERGSTSAEWKFCES